MTSIATSGEHSRVLVELTSERRLNDNGLAGVINGGSSDSLDVVFRFDSGYRGYNPVYALPLGKIVDLNSQRIVGFPRNCDYKKAMDILLKNSPDGANAFARIIDNSEHARKEGHVYLRLRFYRVDDETHASASLIYDNPDNIASLSKA